jgi:benzodiazapine receptor
VGTVRLGVRSRVVRAVFADGDCRVASVAVVRFQKVGLRLFVAQLAANALWTWLFFGWHRGALAAVEILVLLALNVATAAAFWRNSRLATVLLVPYVLWVSFASALTWPVWQSNPGLL